MNDIETLKAMMDETLPLGVFDHDASKRYVAALTRTIALLEAVDAAKVDDAKVWRGDNADLAHLLDRDIEPDWMRVSDLAVLPAATHDALTARCAALEMQVEDYNEAHNYLTRLFKACAPQCEPMEKLSHLSTQIDNYIAGQNEKVAMMRDNMERVKQFSSDTLSGRANGETDIEWYREGFVWLVEHACRALAEGGEPCKE